MSKKKILHLPVKKIYFEQVRDGIKKEEFREQTAYWAKRLECREYDEVHLKLGYPKADDKSKILVLKWNGFVKKTITHEHFGNKPLNVYAIDVSERAVDE